MKRKLNLGNCIENSSRKFDFFFLGMKRKKEIHLFVAVLSAPFSTIPFSQELNSKLGSTGLKNSPVLVKQ